MKNLLASGSSTLRFPNFTFSTPVYRKIKIARVAKVTPLARNVGIERERRKLAVLHSIEKRGQPFESRVDRLNVFLFAKRQIALRRQRAAFPGRSRDAQEKTLHLVSSRPDFLNQDVKRKLQMQPLSDFSGIRSAARFVIDDHALIAVFRLVDPIEPRAQFQLVGVGRVDVRLRSFQQLSQENFGSSYSVNATL